MIKKILISLGILLVLIQFVRPAKNLSDDKQFDISTKYEVPQEISNIMEGACFDCHSNHTRYPWYSNIQPVAWWLANHVKEGKQHLNFSTFTSRRIAVQNHKFEELVEKVEEKEMPLPSYTWMGLHPDADLTDAQRKTLIDWSKAQMALLATEYPADSLVMRRR